RRSHRDAWELASAAFTTLLTVLTGVSVLGIVIAPWLVPLIAPGFGNDPGKVALTTLLTQIMFPYLLFIGLSALAMGVLNSIRSFAAPAFSPVMFNVVIITSALLLASYFPGGPTYLFYGMRLIQFPLGIFGVALATAVLPSLATHAAKGNLDELRETLGFGLRLIFFIIFPAMIGLILLRTPIVHLFFEHGRFSSADTAGTASVVLAYAIGLWAFAGVRIIVAAFYALQDTRTPVMVAAIALAGNILLSLILMRPLAYTGLALATALSAMVNMGLLVVF